VIKLVNDGNAPVLKSDYDDNDPLGFTLTNGRVIQSEIIDASNDYLHKQTKLNRPSPAMVTFSDVILEPKAFFTIKALVIASDQVQDLGIRPIGTVANVRATEVVPTYKEHENVPLLRRTFSGGIEVQLVRIGVYFFGSLALLIGLIVLLSTISDRRQKNKRKRLVNGFRDVSTAEIDKAGEAVLDLFVEHGAGALRVIETLIADPARLQNASKSGKRRVGGGHTYIETMVSTEGEQIIPGSVHFTTDTFFFEQLMEAGVLRKSGQTIEVDANAKRVFESFLHYHKKRTAEKRPNHRVSKQ